MEQLECPLCGKLFGSGQLELHVNSCLDDQEKVRKRKRKIEEEQAKTEEAVKKNVADRFKVLGLRADSGNKKKDKKRNMPSLTELIIAEKRIKEKNRREAEKLKEAEQVKEPQVPIGPIKLAPQVIPTGPDEKIQTIIKLRRDSRLPLAQRLRPTSLDDFHGQEKLVGPNGLLRNMLNSQDIPSFILWGVPGVGKTTLARIIANSSNYKFIELSGPTVTASKLREAFTNAENERRSTDTKTLIFLDEIHRFNKAQQDLLLPVIEKGVVTVIGATTENPSFTLTNALLSRMHTFVMESLDHKALVRILNRGLYLLNQTRKMVFNLHLISLSKDAIDYIADLSSGDARVALNILESVNAYLSGQKFQRLEPSEEKIESIKKLGVVRISKEILEPLLSARNYQKMYDHHGESHYDTISAFHKSIRGSDPDAAIFYLTRMLVGGEDPLFIARRMIIIASEDVGLRDSSCLPFAMAAKEALEFVGMPEGEIVLAHCAVRLAKAPKSTKSYRALRTAQALFKEKPEATSYRIPLHLRNAPTQLMKDMGYGDTYRYNPNFENGVVQQKYLPEELQGIKFLDDKHLGATRDPDVSDEVYEQAERDKQEYLEFKEKRKQLKTQLIEEAMREDNSSFPYDEFLSREDQPEYFNGTEHDEPSDDPDCLTNFEESYDFLPHEDTIHEDRIDFNE